MIQNDNDLENETAKLIEMTQAMVRLDSQTPPSDTRAMADLAAGFLKDLPRIKLTFYEGEAPVMNLVAELDGGLPGPRTILSGHIDTYPVGHVADWTTDPLGGEIRDGRIFGRGSADMKGAVAVLIAVMRDFANRGTFRGSLVLALAGDEERMGELGTQWLIDNVPEVKADGVLVADVGGPRAIRIGEKGMLWLDLRAAGRQAHGAHVHAGQNALDRLIDAVTALREIEELRPTPPEDAVAIINAASAVEEADGPAARETMTRMTMNLGVLQGGLTANLVPSEASAGIDIRIPIGLSTTTVHQAVSGILANHPDVSWQVTRSYEPTWTASTSPLAQACIRAAKKALGGQIWMDGRIGGSDSRLWRRAGYPCIAIGLTPSNLGSPDESCEIKELRELKQVYTAILERLHIDGG
ncbi:M20/M25/M40 family metallo-hydrolase [Seohaeicola saemankumensis]|uniref:M20/M25/M40 family metallo-hydrolase n=1 Tax=Seohaeicola saemankumensis TaxID=481181 RepID=UPI0035CF9C4E